MERKGIKLNWVLSNEIKEVMRDETKVSKIVAKIPITIGYMSDEDYKAIKELKEPE